MSESTAQLDPGVAPVPPARTNTIWLVLVLATCATTWWLSKDALTATVSTVLMILIAAVKVRLVLQEFMAVRTADRVADRRGGLAARCHRGDPRSLSHVIRRSREMASMTDKRVWCGVCEASCGLIATIVPVPRAEAAVVGAVRSGT